jgi:flagellar biosynthesis protein FlhG
LRGGTKQFRDRLPNVSAETGETGTSVRQLNHRISKHAGVKAMEPTIIPIASGKGGVGKSFVAANLAMALAALGKRTVAVDLDLGGANLHTFFGLSNQFPGIGEFLKTQDTRLQELLVCCKNANLKFLPGDGRTPFLANMTFVQKRKLVSGLKGLDAEYILLDLGAGSSFNTLDFYGMSTKGLLVTTPEYPSIMNMLTFLKHQLLRTIERSFAENERILEILVSVYSQSMDTPQTLMGSLQENIAVVDHAAGKMMTDVLKACRPRVVFNLGGHLEDMEVAEQINKTLHSILSIEADYFGFIFEDPVVRQSVKERTAFFDTYPETATGRNFRCIAERIVKFWDEPIQDSHRLLRRSTKNFCDRFAMAS